MAGLWHDLGKYSQAFQDYLCETADGDAGEEKTTIGRVDHSTFGAQYAVQSESGIAGQLLAFCIAGHHGRLPNATARDDSHLRSALDERLKARPPRIPPVSAPSQFQISPNLRLPFSLSNVTDPGFVLAFFARMIFSCLIDADRTATEQFCNPSQAQERNRQKPVLADLRAVFDAFLDGIQRNSQPTPVNRIRARVLQTCEEAANRPQGFFSLNVPTGGGKTFASLAFALHHARHHENLRRVVVAIPFTSIIEQTADQYRRALGPLAARGLVEHHSNLNPEHDTRENKLASENWNAPLIVTTNVQLFESLFAAATTPARKLHRLANSVIVLDEAQTLPVDLLMPTLAALKELVARYGCTVVLCTATQPALERRSDFQIGIENVHPIIADAPALHTELKRVNVVRAGKLRDEQLSQRLADEKAVLCVVNTKAHASKLYDSLVDHLRDDSGCFHLSTFMCAEHRRDTLNEIRERLKNSRPCRVISTQLIEAGVDVDFPVVYRAPTGFDSIAQSAGRCNREGSLRDKQGNPCYGRVYTFDTENLPPPGLLHDAAQASKELADLHPDPLAPSAVEAYFKLLYWSRSHEWDKHGVMPCFQFDPRDKNVKLVPFKFADAADAYRIIREEQTPILVPYNDEAKGLIDHLRSGRPIDYSFFRDAQRYLVSVREDCLRKICDNHTVMPHDIGLWTLENKRAYSPKKGMLPDVVGFGPESLIG